MKRLIAAILAASLPSPAIATSQGSIGGAGAASLTVKPVTGGKVARGKPVLLGSGRAH